jgi:hypothetical protein
MENRAGSVVTHRAETGREQALRVSDPHDLRVLDALVRVGVGNNLGPILLNSFGPNLKIWSNLGL